MIKKIILSTVLILGFSTPSYAVIAMGAKAQTVLSLAAAGIGVADGVDSAKICFSPGFNPVACLRMVGSFGSALLSISSAKQANTTCSQASTAGYCMGGPGSDPTDWDPNFAYNPPPGPGEGNGGPSNSELENIFNEASIPNYGSVGELQSFIEENLKKAKEKGYEFNPTDGSVTGPNGKTTSAAAIAASSNSTVPGLAADSQKAEALVKKYEEHFGISSDGSGGFTNPGGGGSSYAGSKYGDDYDDDYNSSMNSLLSGLKKKKRKPASVKGLVKKIGKGDAIGVAGDNIFEMIARGYKEKIKTKQLIGN